MTTRVGICGAGRISRFHAEGFVAAGAQIVGVADPRLEAALSLASEYGATASGSIEEMITSSNLDIVSIATPHDLHEQQAVFAIENGVDVFMDKPMALNLEGARNILRKASDNDRVLGVCHNLLFHPAVQEAHDLIRSNAIGPVVSAQAWSMGWLDLSPGDFRLDQRRTGGGAWFDAGAHLLYTLERLIAPLEVVQALPARGSSRLGAEDTAVATARFENGAVASMRVSYAYRAPQSDEPWPLGWRQGFEVNGSRGALRILVSPHGEIESFRIGETSWTSRLLEVDFGETFAGAIGDYMARRAGGDSLTTPEDSMRVLGLLGGAFGESN